jgi:hypothetical protein
MKMSDIIWTNVTRNLGELSPWPRNPRQIKTDQAKRLAQSFDEFGQVEMIAIGPSNEVYNGHQRLNVLMSQNGPDYAVECRQSSRPLTEKEREKLTVFLHKGAAGEWNFDILSEWDVPDLLEWGFDEQDLGLGDMEHTDGDKAGASPWERMAGESADGVLFQFGSITCRVDQQVYDHFLSACPDDDIAGYISGLLLQ